MSTLHTFFKIAILLVVIQACMVRGELLNTADSINNLASVIDSSHPQTPANKQLFLHARIVAKQGDDVRNKILKNFLSENKTEKVLAIIEWGEAGWAGVYSLFLVTQKNVFWWNWCVDDPQDRKTACVPIPDTGATHLFYANIKKQFGHYAGQEGALFSSSRIVFFMTIYEGEKVLNSFFCDFPSSIEKTGTHRSETFQQLIEAVDALLKLFEKNGVVIRFWVSK